MDASLIVSSESEETQEAIIANHMIYCNLVIYFHRKENPVVSIRAASLLFDRGTSLHPSYFSPSKKFNLIKKIPIRYSVKNVPG
jgi:hypothetical protein